MNPAVFMCVYKVDPDYKRPPVAVLCKKRHTDALTHTLNNCRDVSDNQIFHHTQKNEWLSSEHVYYSAITQPGTTPLIIH